MRRNRDEQLFSLAYWGPRLGLVAMGLHLLFSALCLSGMGPFQVRAGGLSGVLPVCSPSGIIYVDGATPEAGHTGKVTPCDLCLLNAMSLLLTAVWALVRSHVTSGTTTVWVVPSVPVVPCRAFSSRAPPVSV